MKTASLLEGGNSPVILAIYEEIDISDGSLLFEEAAEVVWLVELRDYYSLKEHADKRARRRV
jgi:hypothetical protein